MRKRKAVRACLVGAVAIAALIAGSAAKSAQSASRIVDLALVCKTVGTGYPDPVRSMDVGASPRLGSNAPTIHVSNGPPPGGIQVNLWTGPYYGKPSGLLFATRSRCVTTTSRAPFAIRGLRGGQTVLGNRYKCDVPARVLIRVRAVFKRPVTLGRTREEFLGRGDMTTADLAVATASDRRPIVYASTHDASGKTSIFVARSDCVPNQ
jgi:hypothetical protein